MGNIGLYFPLLYYFWTNLLTGGPAQICCFMPISVFRGKGISDGVKTEQNQLENLFLEGNPPDGLGLHVRRYGRCSRGWGCPPRVHPLPRGPPVAPPTYPLHPYIPTYPKTSKTEDRLGVPPPEASVATESQSRPVPAPCRRGNPSPVATSSSRTLHDEEGVVLPRD